MSIDTSAPRYRRRRLLPPKPPFLRRRPPPLSPACAGLPRVDYRDGTFRVTFCPTASQACRSSPCYLAATLRRGRDAFQRKLPERRVRAAELGKPMTLNAKTGEGYTGYFLVLWPSQKKEDRRHYPLWSHPRVTQVEDAAPFARIFPVKTRLLDAGGGEALLRKAHRVLRDRAPFRGGKARSRRFDVEILYRSKWDRGEAWGIAGKLRAARVGIRWRVTHWPEATETFVVAIGNPDWRR